MVLEALSRAIDVSAALGELSREVARSVVLVRGTMGSAGSGVMWNQPKLLITNHHVVPGSSAEVVVAGWRRLGARVVRRAPALDLAALEVDGTLDAPVRVGDSDALRVGELVVALGNPMGERNAPSVGVVSLAPDDLLRLAMTLRPGNSGGALVNTRGEVVGIPHMVAGSGLALAVSSRVVGRFLSGFLGETEAELRWV
jgi:serine protease Do